MGKTDRTAAMLRIYKKVIDEIEHRDLSDVETGKLIQLSVLLNQRINDQNKVVEIGCNDGIIKFDEGAYFDLDTLE